MNLLRPLLAPIVVLIFIPFAGGQAPVTPTVQHEANFDAERQQANELFLAGKVLESLPLYEDLCRQDQTIAVFAERHGAGLLRKASTVPAGPARQALEQQAYAELRRAQSLGDNSPYVQNVLDLSSKSLLSSVISGIPLTVGYTHKGTPEAQPVMQEAEAAFGYNDLPKAVKLYIRAAELDPAWYDAKLFAGDMYFRMKDCGNAGIWFEKAIAVDPGRETAYRYWGDCLYRSGDPAGAKTLFEKAVVAEPYARAGWSALRQWAAATKTPMTVPRVNRPDFAAPDGKLRVDPVLENETGDGHASWLVYEKTRVAHGAGVATQIVVAGSTSATGVLTPSGYRHSLAEEMDALTAMLADVQQKLKAGMVAADNLEPGIKTLLQLQQEGMLECWILLNGHDAGIRQDYWTWRESHRDKLVAYLDRYVLNQHPQP